MLNSLYIWCQYMKICVWNGIHLSGSSNYLANTAMSERPWSRACRLPTATHAMPRAASLPVLHREEETRTMHRLSAWLSATQWRIRKSSWCRCHGWFYISVTRQGACLSQEVSFNILKCGREGGKNCHTVLAATPACPDCLVWDPPKKGGETGHVEGAEKQVACLHSHAVR